MFVFNRLWVIRGAGRTLSHSEMKVNQPTFQRHSQPLLRWDGTLHFLASLELWNAAVVKTVAISLTLLRWDLPFLLLALKNSASLTFSRESPSPKSRAVFSLQDVMHRAGKADEGHCCSVPLMYTETPRWVLTCTWTPASADTERWKWPLRLSRRECALRPPSIWCVQFLGAQFAHNHQGHRMLQ